MVEAAGVEPASEGVTGKETTCLAAFPLSPKEEHSRLALRMRQETRAASPGSRRRARTAPGSQPAVRRPDHGPQAKPWRTAT